jgi:hypothetical protein
MTHVIKPEGIEFFEPVTDWSADPVLEPREVQAQEVSVTPWKKLGEDAQPPFIWGHTHRPPRQKIREYHSAHIQDLEEYIKQYPTLDKDYGQYIISSKPPENDPKKRTYSSDIKVLR